MSSCRITLDWLPLPAPILAATGWTEGDIIDLEVVEGTLIATRRENPEAVEEN